VDRTKNELGSVSDLSPRELEIARAYSGGASYREIAARLFIAPTTVRTHLSTIYRKLGVSSKIDLHNVLNGGPSTYETQEDQSALISELALSLEESIRREQALGEILKIINHSHGNLEKVISSVLSYALDLCDAEFGILFEYLGECRYRAKFTLGIPDKFEEWLKQRDAIEVGNDTGLGRITSSRELANITDVRGEEVYRSGDPLRWATADLGGARSFAAIPMLSDDRLIGAFTIYRQQLRPFDGKNLELAQMFADQSSVAIENARLLNR